VVYHSIFFFGDENLSTVHYYLEQDYVHPSSSLVFKTSSTKEITFIIKMAKKKKKNFMGTMRSLLNY
jgi:hypothetical protein